MIKAKYIELEKVSLNDMQVLGLLLNKLAAYQKFRVINRENLTIPTQMELSQKQKLLLYFLLHF